MLRQLVISVAGATCIAAAAATFPYDHVHLSADDTAKAVAWYVTNLGGEDMGKPDRLRFGETLVIFFKKGPGLEGSEGSSVDHIGFSFPDLAAKMKQFQESGVKIVAEVKEVPGKFKYAFIEDPWGTKIEVMEDPETLGFHHIHLKGPEPAAILDWYVNAFGGERTKYKDMLDAVKYGNVWLVAQNSNDELAATKGRSLDHLGWQTRDLDAAAIELKGKGVKFTMEPRPLGDPKAGIKIAFVEGPGGVSIELVQRP